MSGNLQIHRVGSAEHCNVQPGGAFTCI